MIYQWPFTGFPFSIFFSQSDSCENNKKEWHGNVSINPHNSRSNQRIRDDETTSRLLSSRAHMLWIIVYFEQHAKGHCVFLMLSYEK